MSGGRDADPAFDAYKTLQVDPEADPDVIQAAYRRLAHKFHPDRGGGSEAVARMVAINRAWEVLADETRRAAYDAARAAASGTTGASHPTRPASFDPGRSGSSFRAQGAAGTAGPETVSRDWTSGRSSTGATYDPATMRAPDATGAAGPPPGNASGSTLTFGRYVGWSLGEIARKDLEYLEWLDRMPIGRSYRDEIDAILRRTGRRRSAAADASERRGLFRRR